jgi:diguanylate cyclase (GGDEF)-like protein
MICEDSRSDPGIAQALPQALLLKSQAGFLSMNRVLFQWLNLPPSNPSRIFSPDELAGAAHWEDGMAKDLQKFLSGALTFDSDTELMTVMSTGLALSWRWLSADYVMVENVSKWHDQILHLQALSDTDLLTGLGNRRRFQRDFERVIAQTVRGTKIGATLVIFDFDNFKQINDLWGHTKGDQVLSEFGNLAKLCMRPYEFLSRIGGDEFAVLTQHSGMQGARRIQQSISHALSNVLLPDSTHLKASFGFAAIDLLAEGVHETHKDLQSMQNLLYARADADLYKMKALKTQL